MATAHTSYYELLEVAETADPEAIRKAFMTNAKVWHPDKAPEAERPKFEAKFKQLSNAYEVLSDPEERKQYDRELKYERVRIASGAGPSSRPRYRERPPVSEDWETRQWGWDSTQVNPDRQPQGAAARVVQGTGVAAVVVGLVVMLVTLLTIGLISAVVGAFTRPQRRRF